MEQEELKQLMLGDKAQVITECQCGCHQPGVVMMHFVACCETCPNCGRHFEQGIREHEKECGRTQ
jgi:hypothetical protein